MPKLDITCEQCGITQSFDDWTDNYGGVCSECEKELCGKCGQWVEDICKSCSDKLEALYCVEH